MGGGSAVYNTVVRAPAVYNIEIHVRERMGMVCQSKDPELCRITEYASNDYSYDFKDPMGWQSPLIRVTRADHTVRIIVQDHKGPLHCDIYFNGVRVLDTVGGLERGHVGAMLSFNIENMEVASVQELVTKSYTAEGAEKYLTYYVVKGSSWGVVSEHHIEELPKFGWNVHSILMSDLITRGVGTKDSVGIIQPVFSVFQNNYVHIGRLKTFHRRVCGFDVADTDALHPSAVAMANHMDLLMVPSEQSKRVYVNSGVKTRVEAVPHGVGPLFSSPDTAPLHLVPKDGVKILFFFLHSYLRKGHDIVQSVMARLFRERSDIRLIVKGGDPVVQNQRTTTVPGWLREGDLVHLYDACDILFAPSRGGGFELNILEAMARGLPVATSDWPTIQEYTEGHAVTINSRGMVKPLPGDPIHIGYGVDPDPEDAYLKLEYMIENLEELKKKAMAYAPLVRSKYSWSNSAKRIVQCLEAL